MLRFTRYVGVTYDPGLTQKAQILSQKLREGGIAADFVGGGIKSNKAAKKSVSRFLNDEECWCVIVVRGEDQLGFKRSWDERFTDLTPQEALNYITWLEDDKDILPDPEIALSKLGQ